MRVSNFGRGSLVALLAATWVACIAQPQPTDHQPRFEDEPRIPIADAYLNRSHRKNNGLLTSLDDMGMPITSGEATDPLVIEARRFYDTVKAPGALPRALDYPNPFTGELDERATAPLTLDEWKASFGLEPRLEGESIEAFRARTHVIVYYNKSELGLGRELGCARFVDGYDATGAELIGVACFVTNYGAAFRDRHNSMRLAIEGDFPKNTVCITSRPSLGPGYENQFYVYGPDGKRQDWAQLDTIGPRPAPHVCMNCHGGYYDEERHLAKFARFLPADPNVLGFTDESPTTTREAQEEFIREVNLLAMDTPLTPAQRTAFEGLYEGRIREPGAKSVSGWVPEGWRGSDEGRDLYDQVLKPFCATCHLAEQMDFDGDELWSYQAFLSRDAFARAPMLAWVCGDFQMPNAQPTMVGFWGAARGPITIGTTVYPTPADAFLAFFQASRASCANLERVSDCRRGTDPDLLCGDAKSGTACDLGTGQCVPNFPGEAPKDPNAPTGVCRTDGSRGCPAGLRCEQATTAVATYDGVCAPCGRAGQPACGE